MRKCKHENADHLGPGQMYMPYFDHSVGVLVQCEQFRCLDCGHYLSLGPATITPEVEIEIRAAQIAAMLVDLSPNDNAYSIFNNYSEFNGWVEAAMAIPVDDGWSSYPQRAAGYLARCIVTHKSEGT